MENTLPVADRTDQSSPLNEEHHLQLQQAHRRAAKVRTGARVAAVNGWLAAFFALSSVPFAFFSSSALFMAVGLSVVACNEFLGRRQILNFKRQGASRLGWNQIGFIVLIGIYCVWMVGDALAGPGPFSQEMQDKPELAEVLGPMEEYDAIYKLATVGIYGLVGCLCLAFQGWNSFFYFSRRKYIDQYLEETPEWILAMQHKSVP